MRLSIVISTIPKDMILENETTREEGKGLSQEHLVAWQLKSLPKRDAWAYARPSPGVFFIDIFMKALINKF